VGTASLQSIGRSSGRTVRYNFLNEEFLCFLFLDTIVGFLMLVKLCKATVASLCHHTSVVWYCVSDIGMVGCKVL
jgi:hypothetical protein